MASHDAASSLSTFVSKAEEVAGRAWSRMFAENPDIKSPDGFRPLPPPEPNKASAASLHPISPTPQR
jgi:hypothetical protein